MEKQDTENELTTKLHNQEITPFQLIPVFMASTNNADATHTVVAQTAQWIQSVVIGCNFCPFAAKAMLRKSIRYVVWPEANLENSLEKLAEELRFLDHTEDIETTFIIFPNHFTDFEEYLDLVDLAEQLASDLDYDGVYQIASFHPDYCFADADADDPANYTNRSLYPMLHLLREDSVTQAVDHFPDPEGIPGRNIAFAKGKGLQYMQMLRAACLDISA